MAAPKGNRYWESRSSHGPNPKFDNGEQLWEACVGYFEWCHDNPWNRTDFKGKDASRVEIPTERPPSIVGLCVYLEISRETWSQWREREDLSDTVSRVEDVIYAQKIEGATVGAYNPSIVARELGLADKKEITGKDGQPFGVMILPPLDGEGSEDGGD